MTRPAGVPEQRYHCGCLGVLLRTAGLRDHLVSSGPISFLLACWKPPALPTTPASHSIPTYQLTSSSAQEKTISGPGRSRWCVCLSSMYRGGFFVLFARGGRACRTLPGCCVLAFFRRDQPLPAKTAGGFCNLLASLGGWGQHYADFSTTAILWMAGEEGIKKRRWGGFSLPWHCISAARPEPFPRSLPSQHCAYTSFRPSRHRDASVSWALSPERCQLNNRRLQTRMTRHRTWAAY